MSFQVLPALPIPNTVPYLKEDGNNWTIFATCFREAMLARHQWGYLDRMNTCPVLKDAANPTNEESTAVKGWEHDNLIVQCRLSLRLLDWIALHLDAYPTAKAYWDWLIVEFGQPGYEDSRREKELTRDVKSLVT